MSDTAVDASMDKTPKELKAKEAKEVVDEAENGKLKPTNGSADTDENGDDVADNDGEEEEEVDEEDEEDDGEGDEDDEDDETDGVNVKRAAEDDDDEDEVEVKKQKTNDDD